MCNLLCGAPEPSCSGRNRPCCSVFSPIGPRIVLQGISRCSQWSLYKAGRVPYIGQLLMRRYQTFHQRNHVPPIDRPYARRPPLPYRGHYCCRPEDKIENSTAVAFMPSSSRSTYPRARAVPIARRKRGTFSHFLKRFFPRPASRVASRKRRNHRVFAASAGLPITPTHIFPVNFRLPLRT